MNPPTSIQFRGAVYRLVGEKFDPSLRMQEKLTSEQRNAMQKQVILNTVKQLAELTGSLKMDSSFDSVLGKLKENAWKLSNAVAALSQPTGR